MTAHELLAARIVGVALLPAELQQREADAIIAVAIQMGKQAMVANARESARRALPDEGLAACAFERTVVEAGGDA
jgi:hypothetical protein